MVKGAYSFASKRFEITRGTIRFRGGALTDPDINILATTTTNGITANIAITGTGTRPQIAFTSTPVLPQDEVLAYLLFKRSAKDLGPLQLAEIAASVASLTGVGGGGANPLESIRKGLGLDRLSVGSSGSGTGSSASTSNPAPTVEAGRYVRPGVYVGAKQGTTGAQTQAMVQIDILKGLKAQTDVGTGQGGNSVGLSYQFEY